MGLLPHGEERWIEKLANITPDNVIWEFGAFSATEFPPCEMKVYLFFLSLIGLLGIVLYFVGRVMRFVEIDQDIPLTQSHEDSEKYRFEFSANYIPSEVGEALAHYVAPTLLNFIPY